MIESLHVNHYLNLDSEWLKFNRKGSVNNDKIKKDFKLFNKDCIGYNGENYSVFRDIKSGQLCMVDAKDYHELFRHRDHSVYI